VISYELLKLLLQLLQHFGVLRQLLQHLLLLQWVYHQYHSLSRSVDGSYHWDCGGNCVLCGLDCGVELLEEEEDYGEGDAGSAAERFE
jgi:hypothetical protein